MAQVEEFFNRKFIPAFNEGSEHVKAVLLKGVRGEAHDQLAIIMHIGSDDIRIHSGLQKANSRRKARIL